MTRPPSEKSDPHEAAARRRRLAEVFGDVLPDQTSDDRDVGERRSDEQRGDTWLKDQVPPHHGS